MYADDLIILVNTKKDIYILSDTVNNFGFKFLQRSTWERARLWSGAAPGIGDIGGCLGRKMPRWRHKRLIYNDVIHAMYTNALTSHHHPLTLGTRRRKKRREAPGKAVHLLSATMFLCNCAVRTGSVIPGSTGKRCGRLVICSDGFGVCSISYIRREQIGPENTLTIHFKWYKWYIIYYIDDKICIPHVWFPRSSPGVSISLIFTKSTHLSVVSKQTDTHKHIISCGGMAAIGLLRSAACEDHHHLPLNQRREMRFLCEQPGGCLHENWRFRRRFSPTFTLRG